jgi:pyruvate ferredoxin oxidoreductase alpha subunit
MAVETKQPAGAVADHKEMLISGSEACAEALALADIDVVTAYPIRPYDTVMQAIAKKIANGHLEASTSWPRGEHSQFEIVKHASTVGARVFCGSSGVGWMYAMECLTVTPPLRVPMICMVGNRALDDPGAFGVEHNDALVVRDLGWLLIWVDTAQEMLDTDAARLPHRGGPARVPAHRDLADGGVPDPLAGDLPGAEPRPGRQVLAPLRPRRSSCCIRQPDHGGPPGQRGLGHRDPAAERRGDEARHRVIDEAYADFRKVMGRGPENPWFEEYMTGRRGDHPGRHGDRSRCR